MESLKKFKDYFSKFSVFPLIEFFSNLGKDILKRGAAPSRNLPVLDVHDETLAKKLAEIDVKIQEAMQEEDDELRNKEAYELNIANNLEKRLKYLEKKTKIYSHFIPNGDTAAKSKDVAAAVEGEYKTSPPFINGVLREYQIEGLNWMISQYDNGINGILADEMGLGKTIQTIAMLGHLKHVKKIQAIHCIVVPLSVLDNWINEINMFCPALNVVRFYGVKDERQVLMRKLNNPKFLKKIDVVVTTFDMFRIENSTLCKLHFTYLVVDEAHTCKNSDTIRATALQKAKRTNTLLLTGTPLQNNIKELWSLLYLIHSDVFNDSIDFSNWFKDEDCIEYVSTAQRLKDILKPFLLRRLKSEVEIDILPKICVNIYLPITEYQKIWMKKLLDGEVQTMSGDGTMHDFRIANVLMHMRKVMNHPYLFPGAEPEPHQLGEHLLKTSAKMMVLDKLLAKLKERGSRVLIFSQFTTMLDIINDYLFMRNYVFCRLDGETSIETRQELMNEFNAPNSELFVFLISTRAGGVGINLATADTVIFYDNDWNPQMDLQAEDRAHRIGQTKQVRVFRFCIANTIEQKILETAEKKKKLGNMVIQSRNVQQERKDMVQYHLENVDNVVVDDNGLDDEEIIRLISTTSSEDGKSTQYKPTVQKPIPSGYSMMNELSSRKRRLDGSKEAILMPRKSRRLL